jgi:hypothetical protein
VGVTEIVDPDAARAWRSSSSSQASQTWASRTCGQWRLGWTGLCWSHGSAEQARQSGSASVSPRARRQRARRPATVALGAEPGPDEAW